MRRAAKWRRSKMQVRLHINKCMPRLPKIVVYCITSTHMLSLALLYVFYCVFTSIFTRVHPAKRGRGQVFSTAPFGQ